MTGRNRDGDVEIAGNIDEKPAQVNRWKKSKKYTIG